MTLAIVLDRVKRSVGSLYVYVTWISDCDWISTARQADRRRRLTHLSLVCWRQRLLHRQTTVISHSSSVTARSPCRRLPHGRTVLNDWFEVRRSHCYLFKPAERSTGLLTLFLTATNQAWSSLDASRDYFMSWSWSCSGCWYSQLSVLLDSLSRESQDQDQESFISEKIIIWVTVYKYEKYKQNNQDK